MFQRRTRRRRRSSYSHVQPAEARILLSGATVSTATEVVDAYSRTQDRGDYVVGKEVYLFVEAKANGSPLTFKWFQPHGPTVSFTGDATYQHRRKPGVTVNRVKFQIHPNQVGESLRFFARVYNNNSQAKSNVIVINPVEPNEAPVFRTAQAVEQSDGVFHVGDTVTLTSQAEDAEGDALAYSWTQTEGPLVSLSDSDSNDTSFNVSHGLAGKSLVFQATATDGKATVHSEPVTVDVSSQAVPSEDIRLGAIQDTNPIDNSISENAASGTPVGITAFAEPANANSTVTYSLSDHAFHFAIDSETGIVTVAGTSPSQFGPARPPINYENATSHKITVVATSSDGGSPRSAEFTIQVTDVDEFAVGGLTDKDTAPNRVAENALPGTSVGITAFAEDRDASDTVLYSLSDNADRRFAIDPQTGEVTVNRWGIGPTPPPIDREEADDYQITVVATSSGGGAPATANFTIVVDDEDEYDVGTVSDRDSAVNRVSETANVGTTVGITAHAVDLDKTNSKITYSLVRDTDAPLDLPTEEKRFSIDPTTGVVTVGEDFSQLDLGNHKITVRATSQDGSSQAQNFSIDVFATNEYSISSISDSDSTRNEVVEDAAIGTFVGITGNAVDRDVTNNKVTYQLTGDRGPFTINKNSGQIILARSLDVAAGTEFIVTVEATSQDGSSKQRDFTIEVISSNRFDVSPISDQDSRSDRVKQHARVGASVGITAHAVDADLTNNAVTYELQGDDAEYFWIDKLTGEITVNGAIGRDVDETYQIVVVATSEDGSESRKSYIISVAQHSETTTSAVTSAPFYASTGGQATATATTLADSRGPNLVINATQGAWVNFRISGAGSADSINNATARLHIESAAGSDAGNPLKVRPFVDINGQRHFINMPLAMVGQIEAGGTIEVDLTQLVRHIQAYQPYYESSSFYASNDFDLDLDGQHEAADREAFRQVRTNPGSIRNVGLFITSESAADQTIRITSDDSDNFSNRPVLVVNGTEITNEQAVRIRTIIDTFEEVRNSIDLQLYPGVLKGAEVTEQTKAGNNWDQAILLETKLEEAGVSAQIASGTVILPWSNVVPWVGATNSRGALTIIRNSFDLNARTYENGVVFQHAWVRVTLDTPQGPVDIDLQPAVKARSTNPEAITDLGLLEDVPFDEFDFYRESRIVDDDGKLTIDLETVGDLPIDYYERKVNEYFNKQGKSIADVYNDGEIIARHYDAISGSTLTPPDLTLYDDVDDIEDDLKHRITVTLTIDDVNLIPDSGNLPAGSIPNRQQNTQTIFRREIFSSDVGTEPIYLAYTLPRFDELDDSDGRVHSPYLINQPAFFVAEFTIGDETTSYSVPSSVGYRTRLDKPRLTIQHNSPVSGFENLRVDTYEHTFADVIAIGLNAWQHSPASLAEKRQQINDTFSELKEEAQNEGKELPQMPPIELTGKSLSYLVSKYFYDVHQASDRTSNLTGVAEARQQLGSGIAIGKIWVPSGSGVDSYHEDLPFPTIPANLALDIKSLNSTYVPLDGSSIIGDSIAAEQRLILLLANQSALESATIEEFSFAHSVSTVKGFQHAVQNGQDVYEIERRVDGTYRVKTIRNSETVENNLRSLDEVDDFLKNGGLQPNITGKRFHGDDSRNTIRSYLEQGMTVLVPREITVLPDWSGSVYFGRKAETLASGQDTFRQLSTIEAGRNGGEIADKPGSIWEGFPDGNTLGPDLSPFAGDPVNVVNGNMFRDETDFTIPNVGVPISFHRHYDSQSKRDRGLGVGWSFAFSDFLDISSAGVTWHGAKGESHVFEKNSNNTYSNPTTLHGRLFEEGNRYVYIETDGTRYEFQKTGNMGYLKKVVDKNGNGVQIIHNDTKISQVRDIHDASRRISFRYNSDGKIDGITDHAGRTWVFTYQTIGRNQYLSTAESPFSNDDEDLTSQRITRYSYYKSGTFTGLMSRIDEPGGGWHTYEYYANGRVNRVTEGKYAGDNDNVTSHSFVYDLYSRQTNFFDDRGHETVYRYDDLGRTLQTIEPDRSRTRTQYGEGEQEYLVTDFINSIGEQTTYEYSTDRFSSLIAETRQDSLDRESNRLRTAYAYTSPIENPDIRLVESIIVDQGGDDRTTRFEYDEKGNAIRTVSPDGFSQYTTYNDRGLPSEVTNRPSIADFDDFNVESLPGWAPSTDPWINSGGRIGHSGQALLIRQRAPETTHYAVEAVVNSPNYDRDWPSLIARYQSEEAHTRLFLRNSVLWLVTKTGPGNQSNWTPWNTSDLKNAGVYLENGKIANNRDYKLRLEVNDNQLTVFVDDHEIGSVTHASLPTVGLVGLMTSSTTSQFDNFRLYESPTTEFVYNSAGQATLVIAQASADGRLDSTSELDNPLPTGWEISQGTITTSGRHTYDLFRPGTNDVSIEATVWSDNYAASTPRIGFRHPDNASQVVVDAYIYRYPNGSRFAVLRNFASPGKWASIGLEDNQPIDMKLVMNGTTVTLYINGQAVNSVDHVHAESAYAPFIAANGVANFHDVVVRSGSSAQYDKKGGLLRSISNTGIQTEFQNDLLNRPLKQIVNDPDDDGPLSNLVTETEYNASGTIRSITDPRGFTTTFEYDLKNRLLTQTNITEESKISYEYDDAGNAIEITDELGRTTHFVYDSRNRPIQTIDANGSWELVVYNSQGDPIQTTDANGNETSYVYGPFRRLTETVDASGRSHINNYDRFNNVIYSAITYRTEGDEPNLVDAVNVTSNVFDDLNRLVVSRQLGDSGANAILSTLSYAPNGKVFQTTQYDLDKLKEEGKAVPTDPSQLDAEFKRTTTSLSNAARQVLTMVDALGNAWITELDADGKLLREIDPLRRTTTYEYDAAGRLERTILPAPNDDQESTVTLYLRDANGNPITLVTGYASDVSQGRGRRTSYRHDSRNRTRFLVDDEWNVWETIYDETGQVIQTIDALGRVSKTTYTADGQISTTLSPDPDELDGTLLPFISANQYDETGNLIYTSDAQLRNQSFTYDELNRLKTSIGIDPDGPEDKLESTIVSYGFDRFGRQTDVTRTFGDGQTITDHYKYDNLSRVAEQTLAHLSRDALTTKYRYDAFGNNHEIEDARGIVSRTEFDKLNRVLKTYEDFGGAEQVRTGSYYYDNVGNLEKFTDAEEHDTRYFYDNLNRVKSELGPAFHDNNGLLLQPTTNYAYNAFGEIATKTSILDQQTEDTPRRIETAYTYDSLGRMITETNPNRETTRWHYDVLGNLLAIKDAANNITEYRYDALNRQTEKVTSTGSTNFEYDDFGFVNSVTDRNNKTSIFSYDKLGRITTERWESATALPKYTWSYDHRGNLESVSSDTISQEFRYDLLDRQLEHQINLNLPNETLTQLRFENSFNDEIGTHRRTEVIDGFSQGYVVTTYDRRGNVDLIRQVNDNRASSKVQAKDIRFEHNDLGQTTEISRFDAVARRIVSAYEYNDANLLKSISHQNRGTEFSGYDYEYDALSRIVGQTTTSKGEETFTYDDVNQLKEVRGATTETYDYDSNGNREGDGYVIDSQNRTKADGEYTYEYDNEGNLTERRRDQNNYTTFAWDHRNRLASATVVTNGVKEEFTYEYDHRNLRISKTGESAEYFVYDSNEELATRFDATGRGTQRYLYGPGIDNLLAVETYDASGSPTVTWTLADHQGSIRDLRDFSGGTGTQITYDPFGNYTSEPTYDIGFTGREWDADIGLYNYRARWYNPELGKFISEDPAGFSAGAPNLYGYVGNDPVNLVDPSGLGAEDFLPNIFTSPSDNYISVNSLAPLPQGHAGGAAVASNLDFNGFSDTRISSKGYLNELVYENSFIAAPTGAPSYGGFHVVAASPRRERNARVDQQIALYQSTTTSSFGAGLVATLHGVDQIGRVIREGVEGTALHLPGEISNFAYDVGAIPYIYFSGQDVTTNSATFGFLEGNSFSGSQAKILNSFGTSVVAPFQAVGNYYANPSHANGVRLQRVGAELAVGFGGVFSTSWFGSLASNRSLGGTGTFSGRPFDPSNAGGPIRNLTTDRIRVTNRGIDVVEQHLSRFDDYTPNQQMLERLRRIERGELTPTQTDLNFYSHELREFVRYRRQGWRAGVPDDLDARHTLWENSHTATLEDYRLREGPGVLYVQE